MNLVNDQLAHYESVAQWLEHPAAGIWAVMCSIPVEDLDIFFQRS